jgi:hypothetical protein
MQPTPPRHAIRLGDAWEPPQPDGDRVRLTRRFGRPTGLDPGDRVLLVATSATVASDVRLNGMPLPPIAAGGRWEQDVSGLLCDRNELVVLVPADLFVGADAAAASGQAASARGLRGRPPAAIGAVVIEIVAMP